MMQLPVIDMSALFDPTDPIGHRRIADELETACRESGFFYVVGHGVDSVTLTALENASRRFFALPREEKMRIEMTRGGRAWRGFFPVGAELTSGLPDQKEGIYFGTEYAVDGASRLRTRRYRALGLRRPSGFFRKLRRLPDCQGLEGLFTAGRRTTRGFPTWLSEKPLDSWESGLPSGD